MKSSLRWRVAAWYAALLLGVILLSSLFLAFRLRGIIMDQARARVDRVGVDISQYASRSESLVVIGEALTADQELSQPGNLEHWASPTTFIELDNANGYPIAKSANMGSFGFDRAPSPSKGKPSYSVEKTPLGEFLVRSERLEFSDGTKLIVKVGEQLALFEQTLARMWETLGIALALAAFTVIVGSVLIASRAVAPINALTAAIGAIGLDQLHRRVGWRGRNDEVGKLADTFDDMLGRLEEGYARERQFISDASHELKTPLTIINANAQMLERWADRDPGVRDESLSAIRDESAGLARMVNGMLTLAKAESGDAIERSRVSVDDVLREVVKSAQARAQSKGLDLRYLDLSANGNADGKADVNGNADLLRQLFANLIENAIKFTETGKVEVRTARTASSVIVDVTDSGPGIDESEMARVFDRFYRTDKSRSRAVPGTGLGLAIVRSIARVHSGTVEALSAPGGGATFRVTLPTQAAGVSLTSDS